MIQNIKFVANLLRIGGNVVELHHQSVLVIFVPGKVMVYPISSSNLFKKTKKNIRSSNPNPKSIS